MCLIYLAWRRHPRYRLIVAANRDEYHARPAAPAHWWEDAPGMLAGRDLEAGGTWLGTTRGGRFAAITNYHDPVAGRRPDAPSRGVLVGAFLTGGASAPEYLGRVVEAGYRYNGFSLLAMDGDTLAFGSNRYPEVMRLGPGVYGLSNHLLDTPWPKVTEGKAELERLLAEPGVRVPDLLALLSVRSHAGGEALCAYDERDLGPVQAHASRFIMGGGYGTRASTVVLLEADGCGVFVERSFDPQGRAAGLATFELGTGVASRGIGRSNRLAGAGVSGAGSISG